MLFVSKLPTKLNLKNIKINIKVILKTIFNIVALPLYLTITILFYWLYNNNMLFPDIAKGLALSWLTVMVMHYFYSLDSKEENILKSVLLGTAGGIFILEIIFYYSDYLYQLTLHA